MDLSLASLTRQDPARGLRDSVAVEAPIEAVREQRAALVNEGVDLLDILRSSDPEAGVSTAELWRALNRR